MLACSVNDQIPTLVGRHIVMRVLHGEEEVTGDFENAFTWRIESHYFRQQYRFGADETGTNLSAKVGKTDMREVVKALGQLQRQLHCLPADLRHDQRPVVAG